MWRELEERMKIVAENTNARVFSASYNPRYGYPYRLMHAGAVQQSVREQCYELIVDSSYNDPNITNQDVLSAAIDVNADFIIPKDYPGESERTFDSLREFVSLYRDSRCNALVMAVIQPPYRRQYQAHQAFYDQFSHFALGGLHSFETARAQIEAIRSFRNAVGEHRYIHALGVGTSLPLVRALRTDEPFVDSIDISTPERAIKNGQLPDKTWKQVDFQIPRGEDSTTVRAQYSKAVLYQLNYMLSRLVDDDILAAEYQRTELGRFDDVVSDEPPLDGDSTPAPAPTSRPDGGRVGDDSESSSPSSAGPSSSSSASSGSSAQPVESFDTTDGQQSLSVFSQ